MKDWIKSNHWNNADGNPAGGSTYGVGFAISWQNGPLGRHKGGCIPEAEGHCVDGCTRTEPNGAFVETIIDAAVDRLCFYEDSRFACDDNKEAIALLEKALEVLNRRTKDRESRAVEGTHKE